MDKETREMFNAVIAAIDKSEEKTNRRFDELERKMVNMMNEKTQSLYETLHHDINACNLEISACKSAISACESEISACKSAISACESAISECKSEISAFKSEISAFKSAINTCNLKLDSMEVLNGQVKRHESRLTVLEKKVLKTNATERIVPWRK